MRLDDEDSGDGLKLVSGSYGMDVLSACTIVIIAGNLISLKLSSTLRGQDHCAISLSNWLIFLTQNELGQIYIPHIGFSSESAVFLQC